MQCLQQEVTVKTDSDWAADKYDRKSISGSITKINGAIVDWSSKKQSTVSCSSTEAEYISGSEGAKDALHVLELVGEITKGSNVELVKTATLEMDNQGACFMASNDTNTRKSRHISIRYHFIRDLVRRLIIRIRWIPTGENAADIMTKALGKIRYFLFRS